MFTVYVLNVLYLRVEWYGDTSQMFVYYFTHLNFITHKLGARPNFDKTILLQNLNLKMYVVLQKSKN